MGDMRVSTGYLRRLQQEANNELDRRYFAAVAAEIERLRTENENLRAEVARLGSFLHPIGALLAAATKEDDRG